MISCTLKAMQRIRHTHPIEIAMQRHNDNELTYFIYGNGTTQINDSVYSYGNKSFAYYKKGTLHNEIDPVDCDIIWLHFSFEADGVELKEGVFEDPNSELLKVIQKLRCLEMEKEEGSKVLKEACLAEMTVTAMRLQNKKASKERGLERVLEYIDENINSDIDFKLLAHRYNYSYDRFRHLFSERFGISPYSYLLKRRIDQATYLLNNTNFSLTTIAYDTGFKSSSQFLNAFKKIKNITPGEWRKNNKS